MLLTPPSDLQLTYAVVTIDSIEDFVAGFFIGHIVGTYAAEDRRLSEGLPGAVTRLSAILISITEYLDGD